MTNLIQEVKDFGFVNGNIKFGDYVYKVKLINNRQYDKYINLLKEDEKDLSTSYMALKYVISQCLFRTETKKRLFRKPLELKIYDFNIDIYPQVLTDRFIRDLFLILMDKDFFLKLVESEVENIEK